jgi:hypothetical protein
MEVFLDRFAATLARGVHVALMLDQAGWHTAKAIAVPANLSLIHLPPYSPELNPSSGSGCTSASASSRTGSSPTSTPSSTAAATPGTASVQSRAASLP